MKGWGFVWTIWDHLWNWLVRIPRGIAKMKVQFKVWERKVPLLVQKPIAKTNGMGYDEAALVYRKL